MGPDKRIEDVSILINEKLRSLPPTPSEPCIFKVHHQLRQVNDKAYEPLMLAIGPYHRGKDSVKVMEKHKLCYLRDLLVRTNESGVERYIVTLIRLEERARNCYAESVSLGVVEFVEMMLLDGCFIIELFHKCFFVELRHRYDPIYNMDWIRSCLLRDAMLFENQLPFFVLGELFSMTKITNREYNLTEIALHFFQLRLSRLRVLWSSNEIKHLLALKHNCMMPFSVEVFSTGLVTDKEGDWPYIHCATELQEAGVKFKKVVQGDLYDIKFTKGVMEMIPLTITDQTESYLRNLLVYEQHCQGNHLNYITGYVTFMDCLINSSKDVELLRRKGIIENCLGDDEVVSTMFSKLRDHVTSSNVYYAEIMKNVNKHRRKRWNVRMAKLRRNYFHSPWALLSVLAAVLLLVLTLAQTIFSILSYFPNNS